MNVALFGTSADPPTEGHKAILRWLSGRYDEVAVWASDNPLKPQQTPLDRRTTMLQLLLLELETPRKNLRLYRELSSPRAIETIERARQRWGAETQLIFTIGADLVAQLPRWYRAADFLQEVELLIVPRPGYAIAPESLQAIEQIGGKYTLADILPPPVSSSAYRDRGNPSAVPSAVKDYIHQEQLYAWPKAASTR